MWWWRTVRKAKIADELKDRFEIFGEEVLAHAIASGGMDVNSQGVELIGLMRSKRQEILDWLRERRDLRERREDRMETVEWAVLIFVIMGVAVDLILLMSGR